MAGVPSETVIEDGKAGDAVGGVRRVQSSERLIRQRLLAHSDLERSYTYELCEPVVGDVRLCRRGARALDDVLP